MVCINEYDIFEIENGIIDLPCASRHGMFSNWLSILSYCWTQIKQVGKPNWEAATFHEYSGYYEYSEYHEYSEYYKSPKENKENNIGIARAAVSYG